MKKNNSEKSTIEEYKIKWVGWIFGIIALPIIIWLITLIPRPFSPEWYLINETHWLTFFGGYMGACIGILMTFYVMSKTLRQNNANLRTTIQENKANVDETLKQSEENHEALVRLQNETNNKNEELNRKTRELNERLNREQRQVQINTTLYVQEQASIEKLRNMLAENYCTFGFQRLAIAFNYIRASNFDYANQLLLTINRDIEMCSAKTDLYLSPSTINRSAKENEYLKCLKKMTIGYGRLINDFIFIISLLKEIQGKAINMPWIKKFTEDKYESIQKNTAMDPDTRAEYQQKDNIFEKLLELQTHSRDDDTIDDIYNIIDERVHSMLQLHPEKLELLTTANNLLAYREANAKKILRDE